jgi:hypothetical protein
VFGRDVGSSRHDPLLRAAKKLLLNSGPLEFGLAAVAEVRGCQTGHLDLLTAVYSSRSATFGLSEAARRAGIHAANEATHMNANPIVT